MTYSDIEIAEAKAHIADKYSVDEQHALKQFADMMRRPMNRAQRRAMQSQVRKRFR